MRYHIGVRFSAGPVTAALGPVHPASLLAAPMVPASTLNPDRFLNVALALGLVLATVLAAGWLFRRTFKVSRDTQGELRIVGGLSLGVRDRLVLVQTGSRRILLAVSPGRIQSLDVENRLDVSPEFATALAGRMAPGADGEVCDAGQ